MRLCMRAQRPITSDEEQAEAAAAVPPQAPAPISAAPAQPKPQV